MDILSDCMHYLRTLRRILNRHFPNRIALLLLSRYYHITKLLPRHTNHMNSVFPEKSFANLVQGTELRNSQVLYLRLFHLSLCQSVQNFASLLDNNRTLSYKSIRSNNLQLLRFLPIRRLLVQCKNRLATFHSPDLYLNKNHQFLVGGQEVENNHKNCAAYSIYSHALLTQIRSLFFVVIFKNGANMRAKRIYSDACERVLTPHQQNTC